MLPIHGVRNSSPFGCQYGMATRSHTHSLATVSSAAPWHCYYMTYATRYCLVPHPMAVLGRKRM
jgi:hypothetical protein